jgi:hypothetical protein
LYHNQVLATLKEAMNNASYVALTANEVMNMDNQNWISIHGYVLKDWSWIIVLLTMKQIVDGSNSDNLTRVFINSFKLCRGIPKEHITNNLVSFGVDGVSVLQGM